MNTVKYTAEIETPTEYTGYLVDGKMSVPLVDGNRHYREVQEWIAEGNTVEEAFTQTEIDEYNLATAKQLGTDMTSQAIQAEIDSYNALHNIALESVHNAESYSRMMTYTHQPFCLQVWEWSVALWEHMRAWQGTLTGIPTEAEIQAKINELPLTTDEA